MNITNIAGVTNMLIGFQTFIIGLGLVCICKYLEVIHGKLEELAKRECKCDKDDKQ